MIPIPSDQIPVPATQIPFSQWKFAQIPVPILPLQDPQCNTGIKHKSSESMYPLAAVSIFYAEIAKVKAHQLFQSSKSKKKKKNQKRPE